MKTITTKQIENTERDVNFTGGNSLRLILAKDNMGFSLHETHVKKGKWHWHYKNHLEACFCIKGSGIIHDLEKKESHDINVGTCYLLDNHDNHEFEAFEDTVLISVFNPPITGDESHDENGTYDLIPYNNRKKAEIIVKEVNDSASDYEAIEKIQKLI